METIHDALIKYSAIKDSYQVLSFVGINGKIESEKYGGPLTLRQHKIFVYFPYQLSTMKVFENANNKVLMAIPSPKFFKELILNNNYSTGYQPVLMNFFTNLEPEEEWTELFDVYQSKYIHMFVQFDNWQELVDIINNDLPSGLKERHLDVMEKTMIQHQKEQDQNWMEFFNKGL